MHKSSLYRTAERSLGGDLELLLADRRQRGDSYEVIARSLYDDGIVVTGATVRNWCIDLGIEPVAS